MRVIKLGIISIIFFAILITIISLLFPSHIRISKAIDINTSNERVLSAINDTTSWKKWYPGADTLPPQAQITSVTDSSILAKAPGTGNATMGWNTYPSGLPNTVTLQWYMDFHLRWYPWEKFSSLLLEKRYGPLMEKGLGNLKSMLENEMSGK